ncbi:MAG: hypothetical protein ACPGYG_05175, partial [Candidatus Puniceispirillaceae bacterium]
MQMSEDGHGFLAMKENSKKGMPVNLWQSWMSPLQTARARDEAGYLSNDIVTGLIDSPEFKARVREALHAMM